MAFITDIGIAIAGSVDSGKSTFVGVMTDNVLDNGNGSARTSVAKHPHEQSSGKTSDISSKMFISEENNRAITLIDLCGHEKYFKTTAYGITGHYPDYAIMVISANRGILPMSKQHFTILLSSNIPIIIVVTRPDITPENHYHQTLKSIDKYCQNQLKIPAEFINSYYDQSHLTDAYKESRLELLASTFGLTISNKQAIVPVITISNKTGFYVDFIKKFINILTPRKLWENFNLTQIVPQPVISNNEFLIDSCTNRIIKNFIHHMDKKFFSQYSQPMIDAFYIDGIYNPPGIGLVVTGIHRGNTLTIGDSVYIGPFNKEFKEVRIRSLHNYAKQKISSLGDHHRGTLALTSPDKTFLTREFVRKGMIILQNKSLIATNLCYRFKAAITIFNHSATLKTNYAPMLQIGNIRQSARMTINPEENNMREHISTKEYAYVTFKFKSHPEFIEPYQIFVFRSGCVHGVGVILDLIPILSDSDPNPDPLKNRLNRSLKKSIKSI